MAPSFDAKMLIELSVYVAQYNFYDIDHKKQRMVIFVCQLIVYYFY